MSAAPLSSASDNAGAVPPPRRATFYHRHESLLLGSACLLVVLAIWQLCWSMGWISPLFFSGPSAIASKFVELTASGELQSNALFSGRNFLIGFVLAVVISVPLGIVIGWYQRVNMALNPLINAFYATPRIALYPLIIIWFGIGSGSAIFIVFLAASMPILINTIAGVRNIDADLLRAARAFCATDRQIFRTVALPYSVPFILTGVRQAVAHGLIGVIIAELFAGNQGIGFMISYAGQTFATDTLMVGVLVTAVAGMVLGWLTDRLQRYFQRWRPNAN
ncbi:MAG: ABC transporter permease [Burkholderiales bacterium]|nr:ABC transporter permease [Burkholderiales bacterium]